MGQLGDGGGLAAAVHADDQHHMRPGEGGDVQRLGHWRQDFGDFIGHRLTDCGLVGAALEAGVGQFVADAGRSARAEIRGDQRVFKGVELGGFQPCRADDAGEILGEARGGSGQAAGHAGNPAVGARGVQIG